MTVRPITRDDDTADFFQGTARGQFLLRRCLNGHKSEPGVEQCPVCSSTELSWTPAAGRGTIISFATTHERPYGATPAKQTLLAIVELEEGPWWYSQVIDARSEDVVVGAKVEIQFCRADNASEAIPVFVLSRAVQPV
jgi:uncharacterized OB-fold protein